MKLGSTAFYFLFKRINFFCCFGILDFCLLSLSIKVYVQLRGDFQMRLHIKEIPSNEIYITE